MKKLDKKEMKGIQGGFVHNCKDNENGTSYCNVLYDNGWYCEATYNYDGTYNKAINCYQAI